MTTVIGSKVDIEFCEETMPWMHACLSLLGPAFCKIQVVKYLIEEATVNSRTWSKYVQNLAVKYDLPEPLVMFNDKHMSKEAFKTQNEQ